MKPTTKGKMTVTIRPVSYEEYNKLLKKISYLASIYGKQYHAKFTPKGGKK